MLGGHTVAYPETFHRGCVTPIVSNFQHALHCFCRERNLTGEGVITCRTSSMEIANIRRREHIAGGSTHSFKLLDEELSKFVGVDIS